MGRSNDLVAFVITGTYRAFLVSLEPGRSGTGVLHDITTALTAAEQSGDDLRAEAARLAHGFMLTRQPGADRDVGLELLKQGREAALRHRSFTIAAVVADIGTAEVMLEIGDFDSAIALSRQAIDPKFDSGHMPWRAAATSVLVEALLQRGNDSDTAAAQAAVGRLAAVPVEPGFVLFEIPLLRMRALLARANGDKDGYRDFAARYLKRATEVGYQGHIAQAETMVTRDAVRRPPSPGVDGPRP